MSETPAMPYTTEKPWNETRPHTLVVACSDGRLQQNVDDFLQHSLGIAHYDRLYTPGGAGALASSGSDFLRAGFFQREYVALVRMHSIETVILLFHGPAADGPPEAVCADYRRKGPEWSPEEIRRRQDSDAIEVLETGLVPPLRLALSAYRCEVGRGGTVRFVTLPGRTG